MSTQTTYKASPVIWVLIADDRRAQIYQYNKARKIIPLNTSLKHAVYEEKYEGELIAMQETDLKADTIDDYQIGRYRCGTMSNSISTVNHTYESHGDIKEELKRKFVRTLAAKLEKSCIEKSFDRLVLVAPAKMVGELREQLATHVQNRIVAVLPKDITKYHGQALMAYLQDTLIEATHIN